MKSISQQIDEILARRKTQLLLLKEAEQTVNAAFANIRSLKEFQTDIQDNPEQFSSFQSNVDMVDRIAGISTDDFWGKYDRYSHELQKLINRFSRDSLHIIFVGRAGQGKSLVMQNISGLDDAVIPSSDRGDCTGAKSIITNSESDTVEAEIVFYDERQMVEIINRYLQKLTKGRRYITYINEIPGINVDELQAELRSRENVTAEEEEWCEHLRKYIEYFEEYRSDLGSSITVPKEQIEKYVAQYSAGDTDVKYYKYLGVRLANIKTRFPHEDVGKIVLVDTIGIGATSLGTEEKC